MVYTYVNIHPKATSYKHIVLIHGNSTVTGYIAHEFPFLVEEVIKPSGM